ncbi:MAG: hypothetical protein IKR13_02200 [Victivallales bacterium]|nr:hypothetical protein [Victivallales bacterium]
MTTMSDHEHIYIAIDLKSFYASAECADRGLDPLTTNLVVADASRTEKTICLAVSPPLKALGVAGRPRLFEVVEKVREINAERRCHAPGHRFVGNSCNAEELAANPSLELAYITATPRMARYLQVSSDIYGIYLKYVAPEDIHVYSIDEVFLNATPYLRLYRLTAREFATRLIREVLQTTGITATAGIGTNLFLAKVAMDIVAKHSPADEDGVRVAELDEEGFRRQLWTHRPLTDFWRVGAGTAGRLESRGMHTLGDVARMSLVNDELLYKVFGVNAELLIDHAWGWEPCTIAEIKAYRPADHSICSGQVLQEPYDVAHARLVMREMTDQLALDLVERHLVANQVALYIGYDRKSLADTSQGHAYVGEVHIDHYGRAVPKPSHGSANLRKATSSAGVIVEAMTQLFDRLVDPKLLVRRINVTACRVVDEALSQRQSVPVQLELFTDDTAQEQDRMATQAELAREHRRQEAVIAIRKRLGKNALFKGMSLEDGATGRERNRQIGGHKA